MYPVANSTNLHTIPMQPRVPSVAVVGDEASVDLFGPSPVKGDKRKFTYSTQNDFGRVIEKLLFSSPSQGFSSCFFENIKEIGALEGFDVQQPEKQDSFYQQVGIRPDLKVQQTENRSSVYSVRDPKLSTANGFVLEPSCSKSLATALTRLRKRMEVRKDHAAELTKHPSFKGCTIGHVAETKLHRRTPDGLEQGVRRESRLYFEGGNCFRLTDRNEKQRYLIGRDQLIVTHQTLRQNEWFNPWLDPNNPDKRPGSYRDECLFYSKYGTEVNRLYLQKQIPELIQENATRLSDSMDDRAILAVLIEMKAMELLPELRFKSEQDKADGRAIALKYLAQLEFVKSQIFPAELCCQADEVSFVPQAAYHLDLMMAPGPKGSIFLQDYGLVSRLLLKIKGDAEALKLTQVDLQQLESFVEITNMLHKDFNRLMEEVKNELIQAGFTVIPTPGAFFGTNQMKEPLNINFLNCLSGFSKKTGHYYYIASGAQTEGRLGEVLMDAFVEFLNHHCNNTVVYFAGRNPKDDKDFSEAMADLSRTKSQLGPHCLSFELKISPHTEE